MNVKTYMSTLCNAHGATKPTLYLSHVHYASHANNLQHAVIVSWSHELVITLRTPWVRSRCPADYEHKYNVKVNIIVIFKERGYLLADQSKHIYSITYSLPTLLVLGGGLPTLPIASALKVSFEKEFKVVSVAVTFRPLNIQSRT